jgi:hypothetical protein
LIFYKYMLYHIGVHTSKQREECLAFDIGGLRSQAENSF